MKHERERLTIRDTNKMGKYKLRVTREREQEEQRERRGGRLTNYVPNQDLITFLEAKAEIIRLTPNSLQGTTPSPAKP